jgi:hypothetical protein
VIETIIAVTASNQPMVSVIVPLPAVDAWRRATRPDLICVARQR